MNERRHADKALTLTVRLPPPLGSLVESAAAYGSRQDQSIDTPENVVILAVLRYFGGFDPDAEAKETFLELAELLMAWSRQCSIIAEQAKKDKHPVLADFSRGMAELLAMQFSGAVLGSRMATAAPRERRC